ncbi:MAG: tetratricopeptide repeat protein [Acidobacteriaceae bacterium]|nr:tetratricopeptide repeat protein [Acidobacteriaceae bacterium]
MLPLCLTCLWAGQTPVPNSNAKPGLPPVVKQPPSLKAEAYYHFSLGHLYEELAAANGNRSDYLNKAIDNFRLAMKEDPTGASFLVEDIAELYRAAGRIREAVEEAQNALKTNPDDLNARRVLAHIYTQEIGDAQANHIDENMVRRAIEQYKIVSDKDPKDVDSLVMLGRLDRVLNNSVDAEAAFKKVIAMDPDNEDAVTGLASVYSDRGDVRSASELLDKLTKKNPSARAYLSLSNNYEQMKEYSLAADALKKAIDLDPTHLEWNAQLAQDQALAGRYDDALATYQDLAKQTPQDANAYLGMAQIYIEQQKFDLAHQMLDKAKEIEPDNIEAKYNEVQLLDQEGKTPEAIAGLNDLLASTSRKTYDAAQRDVRGRMLEKLGGLYEKNKQYDRAVEAFRETATVDPDKNARAEALIIDTYRTAKNFAKADQESEAAAKKYPNDRTLREVRAQLLTDEGKTDQAVAQLKTLLDGKNDRETYLAIEDVYQKSKNYGEAAKALEQAEKLSSSNDEKAAVYFQRGALYERQKKYDQSEKAFRQVLDTANQKDPIYASTLNYLGYMFADQNTRLQEAQDLIKKALAMEPNNYAFLDSMGWVYYHLNKLDEAERELTRSVQIEAKDPTIHDHLGDVYAKEGKLKEAISQWQSSLQQANSGAASDMEPDDVAKVQKKLDNARIKLAKEQAPSQQ